MSQIRSNPSRIEALALAIARESDCLNPGSEAFQTMNPGLLRSHAPGRLDIVNEDGIRVFNHLRDGLRALDANLEAKCSGKTLAHGEQGRLCPKSTLAELCKTFKYTQTQKVAEYLQDALDNHAISEHTPLSFFLEAPDASR